MRITSLERVLWGLQTEKESCEDYNLRESPMRITRWVITHCRSAQSGFYCSYKVISSNGQDGTYTVWTSTKTDHLVSLTFRPTTYFFSSLFFFRSLFTGCCRVSITVHNTNSPGLAHMGLGELVGKGTRLMIESLRVWILAGAVGEFSSPELTLCADSYSVSIPPPCYCSST